MFHHLNRDARTATAFASQSPCSSKPAPLLETSRVVRNEHPKTTQPEAYASMRAKSQLLVAQGQRTRVAALKSQHLSNLESGAYARSRVANRIRESLPVHLKASSSTLCRSWFVAHEKVASLALRQVLRLVDRRGLKHVADSKRFVSQNCRWYVAFCQFSSWLFPKSEPAL